VLDEPTDGLDPNQKHEVRNLIKRMGERKAIVFSTHILEEVEAACTRVIIIDRGRIVANGTPRELKARSEFAGAVRLQASGITSQALVSELRPLPGVARVDVVEADGTRAQVRIFPDRGRPQQSLTRTIAEFAGDRPWQLEEMHTEEGRLDEVFRAITLPDTVRSAEDRLTEAAA
jgi:ABC-2 type transport system ATP-binding protein